VDDVRFQTPDYAEIPPQRFQGMFEVQTMNRIANLLERLHLFGVVIEKYNRTLEGI
jgi:hypothetical protein